MYKGDPLLAGLIMSSDWLKTPVNVILIRTKMFSRATRAPPLHPNTLGELIMLTRSISPSVNQLDRFFSKAYAPKDTT